MSLVKYVGDTLSPYTIVAMDRDQNTIDLSNAILTLKVDSLDIQTNFTGTGNWSVSDPTNGVASYTWSMTDLANPGLYLLYTVINVGGNVLTLDPVLLNIQPLP